MPLVSASFELDAGLQVAGHSGRLHNCVDIIGMKVKQQGLGSFWFFSTYPLFRLSWSEKAKNLTITHPAKWSFSLLASVAK